MSLWICGVNVELERNQDFGPACRMLSVRACDIGYVYHTVSLSVSVTASAADVTIGISGHGFFMASESLTKHPSGPAMQPTKPVSVANSRRRPWEQTV